MRFVECERIAQKSIFIKKRGVNVRIQPNVYRILDIKRMVKPFFFSIPRTYEHIFPCLPFVSAGCAGKAYKKRKYEPYDDHFYLTSCGVGSSVFTFEVEPQHNILASQQLQQSPQVPQEQQSPPQSTAPQSQSAFT
jgi:hypothetical protein